MRPVPPTPLLPRGTPKSAELHKSDVGSTRDVPPVGVTALPFLEDDTGTAVAALGIGIGIGMDVRMIGGAGAKTGAGGGGGWAKEDGPDGYKGLLDSHEAPLRSPNNATDCPGAAAEEESFIEAELEGLGSPKTPRSVLIPSALLHKDAAPTVE